MTEYTLSAYRCGGRLGCGYQWVGPHIAVQTEAVACPECGKTGVTVQEGDYA